MKVNKMDIRPLPKHIGVGFTSLIPVDFSINGYRVEKLDRFNNYFFTAENYNWPNEKLDQGEGQTIDAFSPNLNKNLHIGHLKQLVVASSLQKLLPKAKFVSMLGAAVGIIPGAKDKIDEWCKLSQFNPKFYFDLDLQCDYKFEDGAGKYSGCKIFVGPLGPIVTITSSGKKTYAYYDLALHQLENPTLYIVGEEQKQHFNSLGFGERHLSLGLVLGLDGKKMSSRDGAMLAEELLNNIQNRLNETSEPRKLAWNIAAYHFLKGAISKSTTYDIKQWTNPLSGGLFLTYTYARCMSIFNKYGIPELTTISKPEIVELLGYVSYSKYYIARAAKERSPHFVCEYAIKLAGILNNIYHKITIKQSDEETKWGFYLATILLGELMQNIGMYLIESV
jgi:arginyl-tRNA synthetase